MYSLKELRIKKMLSLEDLAKLSQVNKGLISRIENGKTKWPHFSTIARLCKVLEVEPLEVKEFVDVMEGKDRPAPVIREAGQYNTEAGADTLAHALK